MNKFEKFLKKQGFVEEGDSYIPPTETDWNFKDLLAVALEDILEQHSQLYREMTKMGIEFHFSKSVEIPKKVQGSFKNLVKIYKEDMQ